MAYNDNQKSFWFDSEVKLEKRYSFWKGYALGILTGGVTIFILLVTVGAAVFGVD